MRSVFAFPNASRMGLLISTCCSTPLDEPAKSNTLIYILEHPSREAAAANWKAFQDDPEWKSVKEKSEANGKLVDKVDSTYMVMTDFSPRLG